MDAMDMDMEYAYSPAPSSVASSVDTDNMTDEELDLYFASCVPLSNLPTPPPAKEIFAAPEVQRKSSEIEVYASHLSKLVPNNIASHRPCTRIIQEFLERANLPAEIVAFAGCLLDALSQRFASSWRAACVTDTQGQNTGFFHFRHQQPYIGSEVIVLAALAIAHGFLSDRDRPSKRWALVEGGGLFTVREIEATKWCLLQDIDYGLMRISEGMVKSMLVNMRRVGNASTRVSSVAVSVTQGTVGLQKEHKRPKLLNMNLQHGMAVWENGLHTPEPSP